MHDMILLLMLVGTSETDGRDLMNTTSRVRHAWQPPATLHLSKRKSIHVNHHIQQERKHERARPPINAVRKTSCQSSSMHNSIDRVPGDGKYVVAFFIQATGNGSTLFSS